MDDNIHALHRDAAARGRIPLNHQQPPLRGRARRLARVALHTHASRHHVFRHAHTGIAVDDDLRMLVHATAVIARISPDFDRDRAVQPDRERVSACGAGDMPERFIGVGGKRVQARVQIAHARLRQVNRDRHQCRHT